MAGLNAVSSFLGNLETNKTFDRIFNVGMLLIITLIVQAVYAIYVRPTAEQLTSKRSNRWSMPTRSTCPTGRS